MWPEMMAMMENFVKFLVEHVVMNPLTFDSKSYAEKLVAMALTDAATVEQFEGVYQVKN